MSPADSNDQQSKLIVHIIDDNAVNRELFEELMDSVSLPWQSHADALAFLDDYTACDVGCLILDVRMPRMSGLQLMDRLQEDGLDVPIILATAHGDVPMAIQAMKQGAFDFHEKPINNQALVESVQRALDERTRALDAAQHVADARANYDQLTPRERDVYRLVVDGSMNKQIAYELDISQRTVEVHRAKVMEKMGARSIADLIKLHILLHGRG